MCEFMKKLFFIFLFLISLNTFAQAIPLDNVVLRLVPSAKTADELLAVKTAQLTQTPNGAKILWQSLVKERDMNAHYPTFKIRANRGVIETDGFIGKSGFFPPALWGNGYIRTDSFSPLWLDPEFLQLKTRDTRAFNAGFLNMNANLLRLVPDKTYQKLIYFQNLYDQYVTAGDIKAGATIKKADVKELKEFIKDFFVMRNLAKTKATIFVNKAKETYPGKIIGNDYFQFVVIDDPLNPLVIHFKIFPEKAPRLFKNVFKDLKDDFEFYVTQIHY